MGSGTAVSGPSEGRAGASLSTTFVGVTTDVRETTSDSDGRRRTSRRISSEWSPGCSTTGAIEKMPDNQFFSSGAGGARKKVLERYHRRARDRKSGRVG